MAGSSAGGSAPTRAASAYPTATTRARGSASCAARWTATSSSSASRGRPEPRRPTLTYSAPQATAPTPAKARVPGRCGASPSAALSSAGGETRARTRPSTAGDAAPNDPSAGFFTSTISAPPASASGASAGVITLTRSRMTGEARNAPNRGSSAGLPLAGRTAVVTGGSSGIGRAIALAFASAGSDVLVSYNRNARGAEEVVAAVQALGRRAAAVQADIGRDEDVSRLVREAFDFFGRVDAWVNNAGADILTGGGAKLSMRAKLDLLLAVDLRGTVLCCWEVAERMKEQGGGVILNMSWAHALTGMAGPEAQLFAAAKGGIVSFSKSLARSVAAEVRVSGLAPGWIATAFAAELDAGEPQRIAETAPLRRWG